MSKSNRQRRAAKAKQRARRAPTPPREDRADWAGEDPYADWFGAGRPSLEAHELLLVLFGHAAGVPASSLGVVIEQELAGRSQAVLAAMEKVLVAEVRAQLSAAWEHGWQPRDLRHAAAKRGKRLGALAAAAIIDHAQVSRAYSRAPEVWLDQLTALRPEADELSVARGLDWRPAAALASRGLSGGQAWADLITVFELLAALPPIARLIPPPSEWGRRPERPTSAKTSVRDRLLSRIRALLAKAEATDHPAEAEAFTAKAQELMTRHAIDEALLHSATSDDVAVETRRVLIESPYASVKAMLLDQVAGPNRCRSVFLAEQDICTVIGTPLDVEQVEMLFTSLLIQATRAMAEAGHQRVGSFDRSTTFRRSFLSAYAIRIGERLEDTSRTTTETYGAELVPVLRREADAVSAEFQRQFPHTRVMNAGYLDARGWRAGRAAADRATFTAGRLTA